MYETSDIKNNLKVELDDHPYTVTYFQFVKPGKGTAFTRTKLKSLINGNVLDRTFRTGEKLKPADIEAVKMQYLYHDGEFFVFMNTETFDQMNIMEEAVGDSKPFLLEEMVCDILLWRGRPIQIDLPNFVELEITYTEPGARGNTAQGVTKSATVSTGAEIQVPLFIENGEWIKIDTRTGAYVERVKK